MKNDTKILIGRTEQRVLTYSANTVQLVEFRNSRRFNTSLFYTPFMLTQFHFILFSDILGDIQKTSVNYMQIASSPNPKTYHLLSSYTRYNFCRWCSHDVNK
jgi:hypothetical protein